MAPANTGKSSRDGAWIQGLHSRYLGKYGDYVNETTASVSLDETRGRPYLTLPSGNVLIASALPGETSTLGSLSFGGNSGLARHTRNVAFEAMNQTSFLINAHPTLPTILYFQTRYEHYEQSLAANRLGSFSLIARSHSAWWPMDSGIDFGGALKPANFSAGNRRFCV